MKQPEDMKQEWNNSSRSVSLHTVDAGKGSEIQLMSSNKSLLKSVTYIPKKCDEILNKKFDDDTWKYTLDKNKQVEPRCWYCRKRFFWYWRHPAARVLFAFLIMLLNFYIYAVDPVAESKRDVELPIAGSLWSILADEWNGNAGNLILRGVTCLIIFIGGPLIGWWVIHRILLKRCLKLKMFGYYDPKELMRMALENESGYQDEIDEYKGSWFTMIVTTVFWGVIWYNMYNAIVPSQYDVDDWLGINEYLFGQLAASMSWMGDSFTFFMILDSMLQQKNKYPHSWIAPSRYGGFWMNTWNGYFRIVVVWICFSIGSIIVVYKVWITNDSEFEEWRLRQEYTTNESERAFIGALIFGLDLAIVTQDWDFPEFRNEEKIMITGFSVLQVSFPPKCIKDNIPSNFWFKINGKWMNYLPLVLVMALDMAAFIALAWYEPGEFGQYTGPDHKIWSIDNSTEADLLGNRFLLTETYDLLNYTIRAGQCIDFSINDCGDSVCNWFERGEYCTYNNDLKLAASFEGATTLWWTCFPFVFFLTVLVSSLIFLRKYQEHLQEETKSERKHLENPEDETNQKDMDVGSQIVGKL